MELKSAMERLENQLQIQKDVLSRKEEEVATLKNERQGFRQLITELHSQVATQNQDVLFEMRTSVGLIRQEVNCLPAFLDEILAGEKGKTFSQLYCDRGRLRSELQKSTSQLEVFKSDKALKTQEIQVLKENLHTLEKFNVKLKQKVEEIQQQLCKEKSRCDGPYVDSLQTPFLLESTAKDVFSSIATFSKVFSKYTNPHGHNPAQSFICTVQSKVHLAGPHHWTTLLKSWICDRMFCNFESEVFVPSRNTALFLNHEDRTSRCFGYFERSNKKGVLNTATCDEGTKKFDSLFEEYFVSICQALLPPDIQQLYTYFTMQGDLSADAKDLLPECGAKFNLVQSLIIAAKKVWNFHKLCLSFEPPATIFRVAAGEPFDQNYMESSVALVSDPKFAPKVGFLIYPGFRLRKSIIKCEVYFGAQT